MSKNITQIDRAGILKVDTKTLYNWRKNKSELYLYSLNLKKELLEINLKDP